MAFEPARRSGVIHRSFDFGGAHDRIYWLFVLPVVVGLLAFFVLPLIQVFWISLSDPTLGGANYLAILENKAIRNVVLTTLRLCIVTTILSVLLGYILAFTITVSSPRMRIALLFATLIPFWTSVLVRAFAWVTLLRSEGVINSFLTSSGIIASPLTMTNNEFGVVVGMVHYMVPYAVLPLLASMNGISSSLIAASRGLGAGALVSFMRVFLPLSKPGIFASLVLVFVMTLGFFVTPIILGGGKSVMIAEYITVQMQQTLRWGIAGALAMALLAVVLAMISILARSMDVGKMLKGGG